MASWTAPVTHVTGDILSVSDWNGIANNETFLYQAPYILAYNSTATSITSSTYTQVTLGGLIASGYGWTVASNNLVVPLTGVYSVEFAITYTPFSTASEAQGYVFHNGSGVLTSSSEFLSSSYDVTSAGSGLILCAANDTLALYGLQQAASSIQTSAASNATFLHAFFIGSQ
jgi:hypothetical protein